MPKSACPIVNIEKLQNFYNDVSDLGGLSNADEIYEIPSNIAHMFEDMPQDILGKIFDKPIGQSINEGTMDENKPSKLQKLQWVEFMRSDDNEDIGCDEGGGVQPKYSSTHSNDLSKLSVKQCNQR